jgi:hypothetical protein
VGVVIVALMALSLAGCAVMNKWYAQTGSDGQIARCYNWGWGWLGTPLAIAEHQNCRSKLEKLGFVPISESDLKAAAQARCVNQWPGDLGRQVLCRDEYMEALKKGRPPRNEITGAPPTRTDDSCGPERYWSGSAGGCVDKPKDCAATEYWSASAGKCMPRDTVSDAGPPTTPPVAKESDPIAPAKPTQPAQPVVAAVTNLEAWVPGRWQSSGGTNALTVRRGLEGKWRWSAGRKQARPNRRVQRLQQRRPTSR